MDPTSNDQDPGIDISKIDRILIVFQQGPGGGPFSAARQRMLELCRLGFKGTFDVCILPYNCKAPIFKLFGDKISEAYIEKSTILSLGELTLDSELTLDTLDDFTELNSVRSLLCQ